MPTLLDDVLESHDGPEPKVLIEDVRAILREKIKPGTEDTGESVALIAERAGVSTRTIYRILNPNEKRDTIELDKADDIVMACDSHLAHCRLKLADGSVRDYADAWA